METVEDLTGGIGAATRASLDQRAGSKSGSSTALIKGQNLKDGCVASRDYVPTPSKLRECRDLLAVIFRFRFDKSAE